MERETGLEPATVQHSEWLATVGFRNAKVANACGDRGTVERYKAKAAEEGTDPEALLFHQRRDPSKPLWDSGVRDALHQAAKAVGL